MFSIGDIGRYFHCLCVAVVVAITAANAVLVGVKSSYFLYKVQVVLTFVPSLFGTNLCGVWG